MSDMAWTAPMTWVDGTPLTAAQLNTQIRDNALVMAPAVATAAGRLIVTDGVNSVAERAPTYANVGTEETTTSASYTDLATEGPTVTVTTGAEAMVWVTARMKNDTINTRCYMSFDTNGSGAADSRSLSFEYPTANGSHRASTGILVTGLTPGENTFTARYRVTAGTGTFRHRDLLVIPL